MLKRLTLLLLLLPVFAMAQAPTDDSTRLSTLSYTPSSQWYKGGNASNGQFGFLNTSTGKWSQLVTGYQFNHYTGGSTQAQINIKVNKIQTIIYADSYTDSLNTSAFNNGAGINTGSAIVKVINAAHAIGGAKIILSGKTYLPTGYTFNNPMVYDNITLVGAAQPYYATDCKSLTGGTIISGGITLFANNFSITNIGLDAGKTACDTYFSGVAQAPFMFVGSTPAGKATTTKVNGYAKNITCLVYSPSASVHNFLWENGSGVYIDNIICCYGIYSFIVKSANVYVGYVKGYENNTYPFIIKSDSVDNRAIAKNVTVQSMTYDLSPPNTTPYVTASAPIAGLNIDANGNDLSNVHINELNVLTSVSYGAYITPRIGNISGIKIDHVNVLGGATNGVAITNNSATNLSFGEINAVNTTTAYTDNSTSTGANYIGNLIVKNTSTGTQGIYLSGAAKRLNIGSYQSVNNTYAYNPSASDTIAVANENVLSNTTYNGGAGVVLTKQTTLVSGTNIKTVNSNSLLGSGNLAVGDALVANPLSQFASTTSAQLRTTLSDETGTGLAYFQGGNLGTPSAGVGTNFTGIPNSALNNSTISGVALGSTLFAYTPGIGIAGNAYTGTSAQGFALDTAGIALTKARAAATYLPLSAGESHPITGPVLMSSNAPQLTWQNNAAGTDAKRYDIVNNSAGQLNFRTVNDANSAANIWIQVSRTGYVPTLVTLNEALAVNGNLSATLPALGSTATNYLTTATAGSGNISYRTAAQTASDLSISLITGTPTIVAGAGAGTSPTVSVGTNGKQLQVNITLGTLPSASSVIATVTLPNALTYTPYPTYSIRNNVAVPVGFDVTASSGSTIVIQTGTIALSAGTYNINISL